MSLEAFFFFFFLGQREEGGNAFFWVFLGSLLNAQHELEVHTLVQDFDGFFSFVCDAG